MKIIIVLIMLLSSSVWAETLSFRNETTYFKGRLEKTSFEAQTSSGDWSTPLNPCNKKMIEDFWHQSKSQITSIKFKTKLKKDSKITAAVNQKEFAVKPADRKLASLNLLPNEIVVLKDKAARTCK